MLLVLTVSPGCYSIAEDREVRELVTPESPVRIVAERWHEVGSLNSPQWGVLQTIAPLVLYPADVVMSTYCCVCFVFDDDTRVRWGPLGALLAIACPGVTAFPMPRGPQIPPRTLALAEFQELRRLVERGQAKPRIAKILGWSADDIESIRLVGLDHE